MNKNGAPSSRNKQAHSLNSRLLTYSATATAALLVTPAVADAAIQNITSITAGSFTANFPGGINNHLSTQPFVAGIFKSLYFFTNQTGGGNLHVVGINGKGMGLDFVAATRPIASISPSNGYQNALVNVIGGIHIKTAGNFINGGTAFGLPYALSCNQHYRSHFGNFKPAGPGQAATGYIGLKHVVSAGQTYYGWLRIQVTEAANGDPGTISLASKNGIYGAYGLASDDIKAGQVAATPEPSVVALGGLALLACGAAGVREQRRRRLAATKTN